MIVPVIWLTRHPDEVDAFGPWDTKILQDAFDGELWQHAWSFDHWKNVALVPEGLARAVVVLPARHHCSAGDVEWLNAELGKLKSCLLILAGDEEAVFPWKKIMHDHCRFWVQHPHPVVHGDMAWAFFYGCGDPYRRSERATHLPSKDENWFFAGQNTHTRRRQAVNGLIKARARTRGELRTTDGFRQGMSPEEYAWNMRRSRVAPCPGGPFTPDTFRFYEALDAGMVPIVDAHSPDVPDGYWNLVYGEDFPFPVVDDWETVGGHIEAILKTWPTSGSQAAEWWILQRRNIVQRLNNDLLDIGFDPPETPWWQQVTVVITTSPARSNPSTDDIVFTIQSIQDSMHLAPGEHVPIVIAADGVRTEQAEMRGPYEEYVRKLCWQSLHENYVQPVVSAEHLHQQRLTRRALRFVTTPLILFVEHDTPFNENTIDWPTAVDAMLYGGLDVLRFHHEHQIHVEHVYMMIDHVRTEVYGLPVMRTRQWSQRPHLANADYYRRTLEAISKFPGNGFIEDTMHSYAGRFPLTNRIGIYAPEGTLCRTYHTDARAGAPKFDNVLMS